MKGFARGLGLKKEPKGWYTRGSLLLKHAPETRSRVSTPTSTHEGHDEAAE